MAGEALRALNTMGEQLAKALGPGYFAPPAAGSTVVTPPAAEPAVGTVTIETLAKAVGDIQAQVATIAEAIKPKTETSEAGDLRKSIDSTVATFEQYGEIMEKALDRIEALEGNGVVRKSAGGDEVFANQGTAAASAATPANVSTSGQEAMAKTATAGQRAGGWDQMLRGMRAHPGKAVILK